MDAKEIALSVDLARRWLALNPDLVGGVALVREGKVYGWKNELRDPQHEQPGALAVSLDGGVWEATGGSEREGAGRWARIKTA